jgi:hypothetical protein
MSAWSGASPPAPRAATRRSSTPFSTAPALWALFLGFSTVMLALGFVALLALDRHAQAAGLAPPWWLRLRLLSPPSSSPASSSACPDGAR